MADDDPAAKDTPGSVGDAERLSAVLDELKRVNALLEEAAEATARVLQFIAIAFAAGVVAALQRPGLFVSVPLFWSAWLLYAQTVDRTTIKRRAYAKHLESRANALLGTSELLWHERLTSRAMGVKPFIFGVQAAYWGALNIAAWVAAVWLLGQESIPLAVVAAAVGTAVWVATVFNIKRTSDFQKKVDEKLSAAPPTGSGDGAPAT